MRIFFISLFDEWALGLRSLVAVLRQRGHDSQLAYLYGIPEMDGNQGENDPEGYHFPPASVSGKDLQQLYTLVRNFKPDMIGISITSHYVGLAERITNDLRRELGVPFVWGGIDPTANPDTAIQCADIVCIGEGEHAMTDLVEAYENGTDITGIANLWVRQNGEIFKNKVRPLEQNLDSFPYPCYDPKGKFYISGGKAIEGGLPETSSLHDVYPVMTARGCPFNCSYCCNSMLRDIYGNKGYIRQRTVDNVMEEIRLARQLNPRIHHLAFYDDVFGHKIEWMREFAPKYKRQVGLTFSCYSYPSTCHPERLAILKEAGVLFTLLGIQTGSQRILTDIYYRKTSFDRIIKATTLLKELGITYMIDLISNNPMETEEDLNETLELLLALPKGFIIHQVSTLSIYRNYPLVEELEKRGHTFEWMENRNVAGAHDQERFRFWNALYLLTQFDGLEADVIRSMTKDEYLKTHPEIVENMARTMMEMTYMPNSRIRRQEYTKQVEQRLYTLQGSRLVRGYFKVKSRLKNRLQSLLPVPTQIDSNGNGAVGQGSNGNGNGHNGNGNHANGNGNGHARTPSAEESTQPVPVTPCVS